MEFFCTYCEKEFFVEKDAITHLKKHHFIIDNLDPINCIVRNCSKTYNTFKGLKHHLKNFVHQTNKEELLCSDVANVADTLSVMHLTESIIESNFLPIQEEVKLQLITF